MVLSDCGSKQSDSTPAPLPFGWSLESPQRLLDLDVTKRKISQFTFDTYLGCLVSPVCRCAWISSARWEWLGHTGTTLRLIV